MKYVISIFLALSLLSGAANAKSIIRDSANGAMVINEPIELNMSISGVKAESIYFGEKEALIILWNKTPKSVKAHLGLALFDRKGKLIGTGVIRVEDFLNLGSTVRSGKQKSFRLNYENFITDIENVASYQVVFSLTAYKKPDPTTSNENL